MMVRRNGIARRLALAVAAALVTAAHAAPLSVSSPKGTIKVDIQADGGQLTWSVSRAGKAVLDAGALGLMLDNKDIGHGAKLGTPHTNAINEKYPTYGNHAEAINRCNEL